MRRGAPAEGWGCVLGNGLAGTPDVGDLRVEYENLWNGSRQLLAAGRVTLDTAPVEVSGRWGVSAVLRPAGGVAATLADVSETLAGFTGRRQTLYGPSEIHTTVRSIEPYRAGVSGDEAAVRAYAEILGGIAGQCGPIRIAYRGLTASAGGVLAQGWPVGDKLYSIRRAFQRELSGRGLSGGPEAESFRRTAHASLVTFAETPCYPEALVEFIEANRRTFYGVASFDSVEIVRYKRTKYAAEPVTLYKVALRGDDSRYPKG